MYLVKLLFLFSSIWVLTTNAQAFDLSKVNFNYLYDGSLDIKHQLALKSDTFSLFLRLDKKPTQLKLYYQNSYKDIEHKQIKYTDSTVRNTDKMYQYELSFQNIQSFKLLVMEFIIDEMKYYYDIQINAGLKLNHPNIVLKSAIDSTVIVDNYIKQGQQIIMSSPMFVYAYQQNFGIAHSPTATKRPTGQINLVMDSVFMVETNVALDSLNQLFFFQIDSSTNLGRGIITVPIHFPKTRTSEELIAPLIYISTKRELEIFKKAKNKKKAFENFWIRNLKSKERAKETIKKFYKNITKANQYFTNYKLGWKTDAGMIYSVFGAPLYIERNEKEEKWYYNRFGEVITFNFEKIPNLFVRQHLRLQRESAHSSYWFREVASWRKGSL